MTCVHLGGGGDTAVFGEEMCNTTVLVPPAWGPLLHADASADGRGRGCPALRQGPVTEGICKHGTRRKVCPVL